MPRTQMVPHILVDLTHSNGAGQPHKKEVDLWVLGTFVYSNWKNRWHSPYILLMEEIPNNHPGCKKNRVNDGIFTISTG